MWECAEISVNSKTLCNYFSTNEAVFLEHVSSFLILNDEKETFVLSIPGTLMPWVMNSLVFSWGGSTCNSGKVSCILHEEVSTLLDMTLSLKFSVMSMKSWTVVSAQLSWL